MKANFDKLAQQVRKKAVIESNDEYAYVAVEFSNAIAEWIDPIELAIFVAEVFPLRDWKDIGYGPDLDESGEFTVSLYWTAEEAAP